MTTITVEHMCIALLANGSSCRRIIARSSSLLLLGLQNDSSYYIACNSTIRVVNFLTHVAVVLATVQMLSKQTLPKSYKVIKKVMARGRKLQ